MERKYYLRGLGLGIVMTAIIMGVALSKNKSMTDEEIMARAKELGMVENTVLADMGSDNTEDVMDDESPDKTDADSLQDMTQAETDMPAEDDAAAGNEEKDGAAEDAGKAEEETVEPVGEGAAGNARESGAADVSADETADAEDGEREEDVKEIITSAVVKTITVNGGDGSYTVARKLADAGVVTSAETFDTFLCEHGYDKRLRTGTFSIPADASDEQIARIVTGAE
ncbi:MAG: hypothetical protein NC416_02635 [Eubacterium sp.]|nr:hypothetical protein [Eubacterium sp.]